VNIAREWMRAAMDGRMPGKLYPGHEATRGKPEGEGPLRCRCALHSLPLTAIPGPALGRNKILSRHVVDKRMIVLGHMHLGGDAGAATGPHTGGESFHEPGWGDSGWARAGRFGLANGRHLPYQKLGVKPPRPYAPRW
jgi:hypothetical protein